MEETIDLRECFEIIKKRFWIIITLTLVCALISGLISFFVLKPVYQASSSVIVNTERGEGNNIITGDQFSVTQKLAVTYGEIIKSRSVLGAVIDNLRLDDTYEDLAKRVIVAPIKDTQIISIKVQDTDPKRARDIANEIPKLFKNGTEKNIDKSNDIRVIDNATLPKKPIKPNKVMNILIAAILGMMIGLFIVFLLEYLDNKLKTPQDIEKNLGIPMLGVVPSEKIGG